MALVDGAEVESYASQRLAHLAIFGPIILTLEAGSVEPDKASLPARGYRVMPQAEFCAGD